MIRKTILPMLLVCALLVGLMPAMAFAQQPVIVLESPRVETVPTRRTAGAPTLASGNYADFLDRVASVPSYVYDLYHWLENNANASGALADPSKAQNYNGDYYHGVYKFSGSESFTFNSRDEIPTVGAKIAEDALAGELAQFIAWAGVATDAFDREHPEVFWLNGRASYSYLAGCSYSIRGNVCTLTYDADMVVWLKYPGFDIRETKYQNPTAVANGIKARDAAVKEILAGCPTGKVADQLAYLNDTLTARNAYNSAAANGNAAAADVDAWECISALTGRTGSAGPVCEGYARAFQLLCQKLNIPCVLTNGTAKSVVNDTPEDHMWNYVQVDGKWYSVDVTWNDPYVTYNPTAAKSGNENQKWFLLGSESQVSPNLTFIQSHIVTNRVRPAGLGFTNGPVLAKDAYGTKPPQFKISGKVTSVGTGALTLELWKDNKLVETQNLSGNSATYTFDEVEAGSYQLKASKATHVSRSLNLTVTDQDVTGSDLKLCQLGDVDGNGKLVMGDVSKLLSHIRGTVSITDAYLLECANVNGGKLNMGDISTLYAHIKGTKKLY